ncbi:MAG: alcohol dehydrogenase catalytic domain-containing protein, partial [Actinobacteria bacterium]|nr:alcohol dehydrogenase catalytic domain-containing protein [Actinomycetota bacterium]
MPGHVDLIEASAPTPSPGQVLVRVLACGLCGTDLTLYQWPEKLAAQLGIRFPIVFGHEFAGRVVEVGPGVQDPAVGNLVTVNPHLFC